MAQKRQSAKKSTAQRRSRKPPPKPPAPLFPTERELIVVTSEGAGVRATSRGVESAVAAAAVDPLDDVLSSARVTLRPLCGVSEERMAAMRSSLPPDEPDSGPVALENYYRAEAPDKDLDEIAERLNELDAVDGAFVAPGPEPAVYVDEDDDVVAPPASDEEPPIHTPNFTARQIYLDAAPAGIDARYAWTVPGGSGGGVQVIDIEGAWRFGHEDLRANQGGVIAGTQSGDLGWRNHGTAVIGEFGGDRTSFGVTGICPDANTRAISIFGGVGAAGAIVRAANALRAGDIILIELHRPGPRFNFTNPNGQRGYIAMEWWPDVFAAIRFAVGRGVVVVEAAGNGSENFDDRLYDTPAPGFPSSWRNPFNPANPSSQAVVVGAGAPPPGTHGRNHGTDRSRLNFSNYGARVDAQGWGLEVTTTGYGDLQGGSNEDEWYTDTFSGTSSASPIVVGALGSVQGVLRAASRPPLDAAGAIALVRSTGSPQQSTAGRPASQRIGNRPDLRQMIARVAPTRTVALYRYYNGRIGDHFYTTNWGELGRGRYGWRYEGIQCWVMSRRTSGTVPLYRYWNPGIGDHFYTTNWRELGRGRYGWRYEGIQCYVRPRRAAGTIPLYRYWNPRIGDHFYTTNWRELGRGRSGYRYEGIQCWVYQRRTSAPPAAPADAGVEVDAPDFGADEVAPPDDLDEDLAPGTPALGDDGPDDEGGSPPGDDGGDGGNDSWDPPGASSFSAADDGTGDDEPPPGDDGGAGAPEGSFEVGGGGGDGDTGVTINVHVHRHG